MLLGTNQIAGITIDFKLDVIIVETMLLGTNQIAGITSNFKVDILSRFIICRSPKNNDILLNLVQ